MAESTVEKAIVAAFLAGVGIFLVATVNNDLPWSTVSPQAKSAAQNAANSVAVAASIDPTQLFEVVLVIVVTVLGIIAWSKRNFEYPSSTSDSAV
jgi:prolipoprotein diacylglyceryltransferase